MLAKTALEGKLYAMQCAGLGPLSPNTIVMGWPWWWRSDPKKHVHNFFAQIHHATLHQKTMLICHVRILRIKNTYP